MSFKVRNIKKQFDIIHNFGFKNLIVSGCSFTYNNHDTAAVTWPYYLRDLGNFEQVYDCSMPGAGNHHISNTLQWALDNNNLDPKESLVIVMWSGNDRDDYICPDSNISGYPFRVKYSNTVSSGITGGLDVKANGNTVKGLKNFSLCKDYESRSIENYLFIRSLWNFLTVNGYQFIFLDYLDRNLISRTLDFDIRKYLPDTIKQKFNQMMTPITDPYEWAIRHNLLTDDDFHPSPDGHLSWTKKILVPELIKISSNESFTLRT